jgi:DNA replication and repair protein RecF
VLSQLTLQNYRNYSQKVFDFESQATIFVGPNAVGKTNILEAIYCLAVGSSFRADKEEEVISSGDNVGRIVGKVDDVELEIVWDNRERFHKFYKVNGIGRRLADFSGHFQAVFFQPEDLDIVIGSPSVRRKYLDVVLSQSHKEYRLAISVYEKGLRQRNRLLYQIKKAEVKIKNVEDQLEYWDELLIKNGEIIHNYRKNFLLFLNNSENDFLNIEVDYDHSVISENRLEKYFDQEIAAGNTLVGPHRDDFKIYYELRTTNYELSSFGSRGQQRLGTLVLKMGEMDYAEKQIGSRPTLLLDDIFSELDAVNRGHVLGLVSRQQTIMTTTDIHKEEEKILDKLGGVKIEMST